MGPYIKIDLNSTYINVSVNHLLPLCDIVRKENGQLEARFSVEIELLKLLEKYFNFKSKLIDAKQNWGYFENGTWTGNVGLVLYGISNLGMCFVTQTEERKHYVDFGQFIYFNERVFFSHSPMRIQRNMLFASPFAFSLWILIFLSTILVTLALNWIQISVNHIWLHLMAIYLKQASKLTRNSTSLSSRLIIAIWTLSALILATAYNSSFYSLLSVSEYEKPIDTVSDLMHAITVENRQIINYYKSVYMQQFVDSTPSNPVYYQLGLNINRIIRAREMGLIDGWSIKTMNNLRKAKNAIQNDQYYDGKMTVRNGSYNTIIHRFTMHNLKSIFLLWIFGIFVGLIFFLMELVHFCCWALPNNLESTLKTEL